jgi:hypothetical protein
MLSIPEKNETIYQVVYGALKEPNIKNLREFGCFQYIIYPILEKNKICMAFKAPGFKEIFNYSGKEFLEEEFKDYKIEENVNIHNNDFDVSIQINTEKFLPIIVKQKKKGLTEEEKQKLKEEQKPLKKEFANFRKLTAEKFSHFRIKVYASVLNKMLIEVKENKNPKVFKMYLNKDNILYILPLSDRIQLIYGINFNQSTDIALTKVFLQELVEAKRHVKNCIDAKIYIDNDPIPNEIKNVVGNDKYSNGLVVFDLYVKDYNMLTKRFNTFVTLREFIQYHIHSIKTFLHIRMNRKGKEIENKLNACRIVPLDYIRALETQSFYDKKEKREENLALHKKESAKINYQK